jgi:hypothetical protein
VPSTQHDAEACVFALRASMEILRPQQYAGLVLFFFFALDSVLIAIVQHVFHSLNGWLKQ